MYLYFAFFSIIAYLFFRHDGGAKIIAYDTCSSTLDITGTSSSNKDYSPNYCPTLTYKKSISSTNVGHSEDWSSTVYSGRVYAVQYKTKSSRFIFFSQINSSLVL